MEGGGPTARRFFLHAPGSAAVRKPESSALDFHDDGFVRLQPQPGFRGPGRPGGNRAHLACDVDRLEVT
jgi:hypothetical protein